MTFLNAKVYGSTDPSAYHAFGEPNQKRGDYRFVMSRSELFNFAKNPRKWLLGAKDEDTKSTEWGSLMDCLVLEPEMFSSRFVSHPGTYSVVKTGETKPWTRKANICDEWCEEKEKAGLTVLKPDDEAAARDAAAFIEQDPELSVLLCDSKFQQMATADYVDKATGLVITLKVLLDIVPLWNPNRKAIIDFKTGRSANPSQWRREIFRYGLHWQGAMYLDVWTAATGEDRCEFYHIVQENEPPFVFEKNAMDAEYIDLGRRAYRAALEKYCRCIKTGEWPGYPIPLEFNRFDGWTYISPEPWMLTASAERIIEMPVQAPDEQPEQDVMGITP